MSDVSWGRVGPELVTEWINFNRNDADWRYDSNDRQSMPAKQTEGVAYLWNVLSDRGVALLADEVGMGKTFQALGVAALLWKMKPNARILVMAPNRDLCLHWRRELNTLVRSHYRVVDHTVKNSVDGGLVPSVEICKSLAELDAAVNRGVSHLYLTTIHSLSGLLRGEDEGDEDPAKAAGKKAGQIHDSLKSESALGAGGFDLIIVDEAHYLRNVNGGSQRVAAARAFFGEEERLAQKALLLTATPSHTRLSDVANIFSYFLPVSDNWSSEADRASYYLRCYGLRRMRLMEGNGKLYSKRHYRHEKSMPATFEGQPEAEGFFALYQKGLVAELNKKNENKSLMYGYLEGFESVGRQAALAVTTGDEESKDSIAETNQGDYSKAADTNLLMRLTDSYYQALGHIPEHPKYGKLIEECTPSESELKTLAPQDLKHLIFVRRIPSVRELTQRLNESYDQLLWGMLSEAWGDKAHSSMPKGLSRDEFEKYVSSMEADDAEGFELNDEDAVDPEEDYLASRVAQLFVVKRRGGGQTDCANVRLRFTKPESLFCLFLEPSSDYLQGGYWHFYSDSERKGKRANYGWAAKYERISGWRLASDLREAVGDIDAPATPYQEELFSVWPLLVKELPEELHQKLREWTHSGRPIAENFANYVKAGFLHASPVIVELYGWFVEFRREMPRTSDVQASYRAFYEFVKPKIRASLMLRYFVAALETFEALCNKIIDHRLDDWRQEWGSLKRLTSPAWHASGDNSSARQRLILGFNSPFYPNVLVSTSVFQEGVNLHLNCHQVHHYGIAGSPGDNEQRVGRIDRLFGCVNRRLVSGNGELSVHYPYLESSVDEDQVASFVERKHRVEERMDACLQAKFDAEYRPTDTRDWEMFLRKPSSFSGQEVVDPYPASFDDLQGGADGYRLHETHSEESIVRALHKLLTKICDGGPDRFEIAESSQTSPKPLFVIDPVVQKGEGQRHQPIFVTLGFSPKFSALVPGTAYIVSLCSPIANADSLNEVDPEELQTLIDDLSGCYPLVRVALDEQASNSYFYLSTRVNFPLFVKDGHLQHLSAYELQKGLEDIKQFSDELEVRLFNESQDLARAQVGNRVVSGPKPLPETFRGRARSNPRGAWTDEGTVARLCQPLSACKLKELLEQTGDGGSSADSVLSLLRLNNRFPFVNLLRSSEGYQEAQLNFPSGDFQSEERELLERWFQYVVVD
ncbi:MAG: DEAD/DEAH box helicase [Marinobacter sp.]|nr:DEAD/DEAH box helicase [Marinobacter sp.]